MLNSIDPQIKVSVYRKIHNQSSVKLECDTIILQFSTGTYSTLNETGTFIWECLDTPASFDHIKEMVLNNFNVDEERCIHDLEFFLSELKKNNLITQE